MIMSDIFESQLDFSASQWASVCSQLPCYVQILDTNLAYIWQLTYKDFKMAQMNRPHAISIEYW